MTAPRNILIGTPCYGGLLTQVYVQSLVALMANVRQLGAPGSSEVGLSLRTHQDSLITRARNSILTIFLDDPSLTHLLFIDADTGFELEQVKRMLDFDEELVCGVYPVKTFDWPRIAMGSPGRTGEQMRASGLHYVGVPAVGAAREERDGFVTAQYAGTGFMLIRRSCAEKMIAAYPETKYRSAHIGEPPSENRYNLFDCVIDPENGIYLSEDYTFCQRWRKLGGKVWLDLRSRLKHVGTYEFQGTPTMELTRKA